jgi:hypothetical protein
MRSFISLYTSQYIIRVVKSKRKRWEGDVTHMGEMGGDAACMGEII